MAMSLLLMPKLLQLDTHTQSLLSEVISIFNERQNIIDNKVINLNTEGSEVMQTKDVKSLTIHLNNYAAVLSIINRLKNNTEELNILELGCGSGLFSHALVNCYREKCRLLGVDYNLNLIEFAKYFALNKDQVNFQHSNVLSLPPNLLRRVDIVFFCELWEHLSKSDATNLLKTLYKNITNDCLVIFSTPDLTSFKKQKTYYHAHKMEYTFKSLKLFLKDSKNNPFRNSDIFKIINPRLTKDVVFANDTFGLYLNYLYKKIRPFLISNNPLKMLHESISLTIFKLLQIIRSDDMEKIIKDRYFSSILKQCPKSDKESFSLITILRK